MDEQRKTSEAARRAIAKYNKNNTTVLSLRLNNATDADILERLRTVGNKQGYIKDLIRTDIKKPV